MGDIHLKKYTWKEVMKRFGRDPFRLSKENVNSFISCAGIAFTKYSEMKERFNDVVLRLQKGGIIDHITESYYYYWRPDPPEETLKSIDLSHLTVGLGIFASGLFFGFVSFLIEKFGKSRAKSDTIELQFTQEL